MVPVRPVIAADRGAAFGRARDPAPRAEHPRPMTTREIVTAYLRAIEAQDSEAVARYMHPDIEVTEHPNRMSPRGLRTDLAGVRAAWDRGKALRIPRSAYWSLEGRPVATGERARRWAGTSAQRRAWRRQRSRAVAPSAEAQGHRSLQMINHHTMTPLCHRDGRAGESGNKPSRVAVCTERQWSGLVRSDTAHP
jgi:hypothetical protein